MKMKRSAVAGLVAFCLATSAQAATLTISSIDGVWRNPAPAVEGAGTSNLRWGVPAGSGKSGYDFEPAGETVSATSDENFVLGTFSHLNFPVFAPFLSSVDLEVSFRIEGLDEPLTSVFSFEHLETVNGASSCPNGIANRVGVNASGCADRVSAVLNLGESEIFSIDGLNYVLDVTGFFYDEATFVNFWTEEEKRNSAQLVAQFSTDVPQDDPGTPVTPVGVPVSPVVTTVPLPASGLLLVGGMLAIAGFRRKR